MRKVLFFISMFLLFSLAIQADDDKKKGNKEEAKVETSSKPDDKKAGKKEKNKKDKKAGKEENKNETQAAQPETKPAEVIKPKVNPIDSLHHLSSALLSNLRQQAGLQPVATPNLNKFIDQLITDTVPEHEKQRLDLCRQVMRDLRYVNLADKSKCQEMVTFIEQCEAIDLARNTLNQPYDANRIKQATQLLLQKKEKGLFSERMAQQVESLTKSLNYYERKIVLRRVNDLADELLSLRPLAPEDSTITSEANEAEMLEEQESPSDTIAAWSVTTDSLFHSAVDHEGRNKFIAFVPYADGLRTQMVNAFTIDDQGHVLVGLTHWDIIEAVKQEVESVLSH